VTNELPTSRESPVDAAVRRAVEDTTFSYQVLIDLEAFDTQFVRGVLGLVVRFSGQGLVVRV
jgi:hypothetical protein